MNLTELKQKLNNENDQLLMYFPIPRTGGISMSYFIQNSDTIFTCRNYELESCFYQQHKTIPPVPQTSTDKNDWDLIYFVSEDQSFFINKLSDIQKGFYENIFNHENKTIFTIVRNPIDRLFSIWNYCTHSTRVYQLFSLSNKQSSYKIEDFNDFVREFATNGLPNKYPTKMFLPMSDLLDVELGEKIIIYKFEEKEKYLDFLMNNYNVAEEYKYYNYSNKSTEKIISEKTLELIHDLYHKDFERFGYL